MLLVLLCVLLVAVADFVNWSGYCGWCLLFVVCLSLLFVYWCCRVFVAVGVDCAVYCCCRRCC